MKKITNVLFILALTVICVFALASCGGHSHTYGEEWTSDAINHWHAATCEHTDAQGDLAAHTYDASYECTVCGYAHTHTYQTEWSFDADQHWKAAGCGHADAKSEVANHDYNSDGVCLSCGYYPDVEAGAHNHTFALDWSSDDTGHWKDGACGHSVRADFAAHAYQQFAGGLYLCQTCYYSHTHSYDAVWSADSSGHWHGTLCGHDSKIDQAAHTYVDGVCSACGFYDKEEHTLAEEWSADDTGHWYACTCHGIKFDHKAHSYGENFICTVCEYRHRHKTDSQKFDFDFGGHWHVVTCGHDVKTDYAAHTFVGNVCSTCGYDISGLTSDELAAIAVIYSNSNPTKVTTNSKQSFAGIELDGTLILTVADIRGKAVAVYEVIQDELRSLEAGGRDEYIREEIVTNHTITQYYEGLGTRTVNPVNLDASAWDAEGVSFIPAKGGITLDLRLGYIQDLSYEDGVLTCVVPAAFTVNVFGADAGADVTLTVKTAGGQIEYVNVHYVVPADEANGLAETTVDITTTYEYDEQIINID